jgi:Domain of unknown function (DUF4287)
MTESKTFKRRVRERMSKTGESYTAARTQVGQKRDRVRAARTKLASAPMPVSEDKLKEHTGRKWDAWFSILDRWGARERKHGETADYLMKEHDVAGWYAQAITVGYERARGLRVKHQNARGFSVSASKTIGVPIDVAFEAVVDARKRRKWLTDSTMRIRTKQENKSARFDWEDGTTRVNAWFEKKGPSKTTIGFMHEKLPDADEAETMKQMWRERLVDLKSLLES